jgi:hypothetical protein
MQHHRQDGDPDSHEHDHAARADSGEEHCHAEQG